MTHLTWLLLSLSASAALASPSPIPEAEKIALAGRSGNVHARQVIETCAGSLVFQRCGGPWCAPPGMYCCGIGACLVGSQCLDSQFCCFAGMTEQQCRARMDEARSVVNNPSALASLLSRSDVMNLLTASFTGFPAGGMPTAPAGTANGAAPSNFAISNSGGGGGNSGGGGGGGSNSGGGGGSSGGGNSGRPGNSRALSTNGQKRRTVDLDDEVEYTEEWSTEVSCSPENQGKLTKATGATLKMEIATDVAGFTLSHSVGSDGKLSMSQGMSAAAAGITVGNDVSMEAQVIPNPTATNQTVVDSGCTVSYIFTRGMSYGLMEETVSLIWEFPVTSPARRQEAGGSWGRINAITLYSDQAEIEALKTGSAMVIEMGPKSNNSGGAASGTGAASGPSAPTAASGAGRLAVPALGAVVGAALLFV